MRGLTFVLDVRLCVITCLLTPNPLAPSSPPLQPPPAGLLSLLFSFMIIWDLPRLGVGVKKLARSRFGFAYQVRD